MDILPSLSIFFPAYNDAKILPYLIAKTYDAAAAATSDFEVIIVDDGSTDDTARIMKSLMPRYPHLRHVRHETNRGYGGALISGFRNARKEWVFYTDGDCQYDPADLRKLVRKAGPGVDVVNGYKLNRGDGIFRLLTGSVYNSVLHRLYKVPIRDVDCDFRLIRRSVLQKITLTSSSGTICLELVLKLNNAGAVFREVAVRHYPRPVGSSKFLNLPNLIRTAHDNISFYVHRTLL